MSYFAMLVKKADMLQVYGLQNCDTCKKAQNWLQEHGVEYEFNDVRKDGVSKAQLKKWLSSPAADKLVNRRSTTWRGLSTAEKTLSESEPLELLLKYPTLIKRPVLERHGKLLQVGFSEAEFKKHLLS